jgi:hypothetical protein
VKFYQYRAIIAGMPIDPSLRTVLFFFSSFSSPDDAIVWIKGHL